MSIMWFNRNKSGWYGIHSSFELKKQSKLNGVANDLLIPKKNLTKICNPKPLYSADLSCVDKPQTESSKEFIPLSGISHDCQ